jgi:hypothetical protein
MVDAEDLKKRYASMSDDQLVRFAHKERGNLTALALEIILAELQTRGIDTTFTKATQQPRQHDIYDKLSEAWDFAFEKRKAGETDEAIIEALKNKGIPAGKAEVILKRLPDAERNDDFFEKLIVARCEGSSARVVIMMLFLSGGGFFMMLAGGALGILLGLVMISTAIFCVVRFKSEFMGGTYWAGMIKNNPENIVWIKPILEKTTLSLVITLFTTRQYQLLTKDNQKIIMNCDSDHEQKIFVGGVKHYLPHAHVGYSLQMVNAYEADPAKFIATVQRKNIYTPIDTFEIK